MAAKGFHDVFVILDTFRKSRSSAPENGVFIFDIIPQNYTREHVLGITKDLTNIVEMQINSFQLAALPIITTQTIYDTNSSVLNGEEPLDSTRNTITQLDGSEEISVYIEETGTQSISNCYGRDIIRYNFQLFTSQVVLVDTHGALSVGNADGPVTTNPIKNRTIQSNNYMDTYRFQEPIHLDRRLSLTIRDPDAPINFLPDVYYNVQAKYLSCNSPNLAPGVVPVAGRAYLVYLINNHRLQVDDIITVRDRNNNIVGPAKMLVGPSYDVTDGVVNIPAANVLFTNPVSYQANETSVGFFTIYVHNRRMRIPMRFRKLVTDE